MRYLRDILHLTSVPILAETRQLLWASWYILQHNLHTRNISLFDPENKSKEYYFKKLVGYSCEQMYDVVADINNYKQFLPFCKNSFILSESSDYIEAVLVIGFPPVVESYTSRVSFVRPYFTKAVCNDGRLFNHLITSWKFNPGLMSNSNSCIVEFDVDFEFKSLLHSHLASIFFDKVVMQMEGAFLIEAKRRYGQETLPSHTLICRKR